MFTSGIYAVILHAQPLHGLQNVLFACHDVEVNRCRDVDVFIREVMVFGAVKGRAVLEVR